MKILKKKIKEKEGSIHCHFLSLFALTYAYVTSTLCNISPVEVQTTVIESP